MQTEDAVSILEVLREYVRSKPAGTALDWLTIEMESGVRMDRVGRNAIRRALKKESIEVSNMPARAGLQLSSPDNAAGMSRERQIGVARAMDRASKFSRRLLRQHEEQLSTENKQRLIRDIGVGASVKVALLVATEVPRALPEKPPSDTTLSVFVRRKKGGDDGGSPRSI